MHVLHLIKTSEGAAWALNLLREIKTQHPEITFSVVITPGGKRFEEYKVICKSVYEFDYSIGLGLIKKGLSLRKIVSQEKPDIIHSWFTQTTLYARLFLRKIKTPRLFQVVGPLHLDSKIFKFFDIKSAQENDFWMPTSSYIYKKYSKSGINANRLFLNYAFIDTAKYLEKTNLSAPEKFKNSLNIPPASKIIGTASYIYPPKFWQKTGLKNHEFLLEIFGEILKTHKDVVLVIAGETFGGNKNYEARLKKLAKSIDRERIIFSGKYNEPYAVVASFDVFVYLSKSENLGGAFESLLFQVPTVTSNRGGLPEIVINNETGFACDLNDKETIISSINKALSGSEEIEKFKKKGKEKVLEVFNKQEIIEKTIRAYSKILEIAKTKNFS